MPIAKTPASDQACRVCGCTERRGCAEGCFWVEPDLCSACDGAATHQPVSVGRNADGSDQYAHCSCGWGVVLRRGEEGAAEEARRIHWAHAAGRDVVCA